ncbi:hypothetical protein BsWGS_18740 [Bradybaena similaris]
MEQRNIIFTKCPVVFDLPEGFFTSYKASRGPVLGSGMSGHVVLATSTTDPSKKRAVKILPLLTRDMGITSMRLFTKEVRAIQGLSHPHVIKHVLSARCPGYLVICTDYCPGGTLTSRLTNMTLHLSMKYFLQMASAVRYLNDIKGIVHSDIKPDNIFFNAKHYPVLGDFGLSFFIPPGNTMVSTKAMGGTPFFSAPEKVYQPFVDPYKLDVYSLGVVLWCMLFKRQPTSNKVHQCLQDRHMLSNFPQPVIQCLASTLQVDYYKRHSAAALLNSLHRTGHYRTFIDHLNAQGC